MERILASCNGIDIFHNFVALHKSQLEASGVPRHFWEVLCHKLHDQVFDGGNTFSVLKIDYDERRTHDPLWKVVVTSDVKKSDPCNIFLIDHAWTYKVDFARIHLREIPGLLKRMCYLMAIEEFCDDCDSSCTENCIDKVFDEMWKFNQTYSLGAALNIEEQSPIWYIMDELGSTIQHSDNPSFRTVPFIYMPDQVTYSILFPVQDVKLGEEVTRDYVEGYIKDSLTRKALLHPWQPTSFCSVPFFQNEPDSDYFLEGRVVETLPNVENFVPVLKSDHIFKVYSEYKFVNSYLNHPLFEIVSDEESADILWYTDHFKNFKEFSEKYPHKYVNQFPFEHVITVKDLLSIVCRRNLSSSKCDRTDVLEMYPSWFPTTYNLKTELPEFVSYFQHREKSGLDNHWICKPFNLARGLDTHITNNLNYILRLPFTGPKIAQKYLEYPVLFNRLEIGLVKFDIRYVLILKSVSPLKAYAYRNFFLRFANVPFELRDFENYEKHFTVMNYNDNADLCRMLCDEFIQKFEEQYNCDWNDVEEKIFEMLSKMFQAATVKVPPAGIAHNPQSRAVYAVDLMLSWKNDISGSKIMQPKLLEVNWCPDCKRACEYYPDFYNKIFGLLFANEHDESFREL